MLRARRRRARLAEVALARLPRAAAAVGRGHKRVRVAQAAHVAGAYLADFSDEDAGPKPTHFREVFRTKGPGNYFHGKQAEAKNVSV